MRNAFCRALIREARRNPRIILLTGDLGFTVFEKYRHFCGNQFINMGASEASMIGTACGLAASGYIPVVYSIATFASMRGFEQIRTDIGIHQSNVKIIGSGAGLSYGHAGNTHHALEDIGLMRLIPGFSVVCPSDPVQAEALTRLVISHRGPVYLRLGKKGEPVLYPLHTPFKIGKAVLVSPGVRIALIATGSMVKTAIDVRKQLRKHGVRVQLWDIHTVKPLDPAVITSVKRSFSAVFTLEEHFVTGGLGSAVSDHLTGFGDRGIYCYRFGIPDQYPSKVGSQSYLRNVNGLSVDHITRRILSWAKKT